MTNGTAWKESHLDGQGDRSGIGFSLTPNGARISSMNRELGDANKGRQYCHEYITEQSGLVRPKRHCTKESCLGHKLAGVACHQVWFNKNTQEKIDPDELQISYETY